MSGGGSSFLVVLTETFTRWLAAVDDERALARIDSQVRRLELGLFGNARTVGGGLHEARIDYGPGYRLYFVQTGAAVIVLLCGGDKRTQAADIKQARRLAKTVDPR